MFARFLTFSLFIVTLSSSLRADVDLVEAAGWPPSILPSAPTEGPSLCRRDFLTPEQGAAVLAGAEAQFSDRASWDAFAALARQRIQEGAGLSPWPRRTPLNAIMRNRRTYDGYTVESVSFESIPGYIVTGNLYLPIEVSHPVPAILHTHGHSSAYNGPEGWIKHGRFKADVQLRAAALARMGAVCLTIDMFGYGDSIVFLGDQAHRTPVALTMQVWNAIRALDFLEGLPEVDPGRLAVTGHSGGGTQAFLLSALDQRVAVSVPVAMVSSYFFGGCDCESGLPIHRSKDFFANNAMIAALAAPRPQLLVSDGGDWSQYTPGVEYPFLQHIYGYYGADDHVKNVHLPEEGHNYGPSKRLAMYPFVAKHLGLNLAAIQASDGSIDESMLTVENPNKMHALAVNDPRLASALKTAAAIRRELNQLQSEAVR